MANIQFAHVVSPNTNMNGKCAVGAVVVVLSARSLFLLANCNGAVRVYPATDRRWPSAISMEMPVVNGFLCASASFWNGRDRSQFPSHPHFLFRAHRHTRGVEREESAIRPAQMELPAFHAAPSITMTTRRFRNS